MFFEIWKKTKNTYSRALVQTVPCCQLMWEAEGRLAIELLRPTARELHKRLRVEQSTHRLECLKLHCIRTLENNKENYVQNVKPCKTQRSYDNLNKNLLPTTKQFVTLSFIIINLLYFIIIIINNCHYFISWRVLERTWQQYTHKSSEQAKNSILTTTLC